MIFFSSSSRFAMRAGLPSAKNGSILLNTSSMALASLSPPLAFLPTLIIARLTASRSARASSVLMVSISDNGLTRPSTWITLSSSKQRTTWAIASVSRILAKNWLPMPSPLEAPATRPAISTNSIEVGTTRSGLTISASCLRRGSGTGTIPVLGSLVQNGKFSAAIPALVNALNKVDLPTFGSPTIPQLKPIQCSLNKGLVKFVAL